MEYSRDWSKFDWEKIDQNIKEGKDIGISKEEYIEYLQYLRVERPKESLQLSLYAILVEEYNLDEKVAAYWASRPEQLEEYLVGKLLEYDLDDMQGISELDIEDVIDEEDDD